MKARWLGDGKEETVVIYCPGCKDRHYLNVRVENGRPCWGFNNNMGSPTFTPFLLVRTGKYVDPNFVEENPGDSTICHSFITDGVIRYLEDSTHHLKGTSIELPDVNTPLPYL